MKDPNYAPMYCAMYPELASITRKHGYALAVHGTLGRDMDIVCIPWSEVVSEPKAVVDEITTRFAVHVVGGPPTKKNHGREAWTISVGFGECAIDLSFMRSAIHAQELDAELASLRDRYDRLSEAYKRLSADFSAVSEL